jgi:hypothetical protein
MPPLLQHVCINHGRRDIVVAEQGLDGANIRASLEEMSCKTVAKAVRCDPFGDPRPRRC